MSEKNREHWEQLGSCDPYWAVLSVPCKIGGKWDKDVFFLTGTHEINQIFSHLRQMKVDIRTESALDFGCGVGRLSRALSGLFAHVIGIDVSQSMLKEARFENRSFDNIRFLHNANENLYQIEGQSIDFLISMIALQHIPTRSQKSYLREFCRVLRPGGVMVFQALDRQNFKTLTGCAHYLAGNQVLNQFRKIRYGRKRVMELHMLKKETVFEVLSDFGMDIFRIESTNAAGIGFVSYSYYAKKR